MKYFIVIISMIFILSLPVEGAARKRRKKTDSSKRSERKVKKDDKESKEQKAKQKIKKLKAKIRKNALNILWQVRIKFKKEDKVKPKVKDKGKKKVDEFGFGVKSQNHSFIMAIKKKPMTMAEVKTLSWNNKNATFYNIWRKLQGEGIGDKDENGKMRIK